LALSPKYQRAEKIENQVPRENHMWERHEYHASELGAWRLAMCGKVIHSDQDTTGEIILELSNVVE